MDEIVIRLRPKHIERMVFVVIILILVGLLLYKTNTDTSSNVEVVNAASQAALVAKENNVDTTQTKAEEVIAKESVVEKPIPDEPVVEEPATEAEVVEKTEATPAVENTTTNEVTAKDEVETALSGKRTFTITDIKTTIKGDDWAKLDSFNLKVENGLAGVYITYKVYIYNYGDNPAEFADQTVTLSKIEQGEIFDKVQDWGGESFVEISNKKKLKVVFQDSLGEVLDTIIMDFKA